MTDAERIGQLVLTNWRQADEIERLQKENAELQTALAKATVVAQESEEESE